MAAKRCWSLVFRRYVPRLRSGFRRSLEVVRARKARFGIVGGLVSLGTAFQTYSIAYAEEVSNAKKNSNPLVSRFEKFASETSADGKVAIMNTAGLIKSLAPDGWKDARDLDPNELKQLDLVLSKFVPSESNSLAVGLRSEHFCMIHCLLTVAPMDYSLTFRIADRSASGTISECQFLDMLMHILPPSVDRYGFDLEASGHLPIFGKNGDKELSFKDFEQHLSDLRQAVNTACFNTIDENKDGSVSALEFGRYVLSFGPRNRLTDFEMGLAKNRDKKKVMSSILVDLESYLQYQQMHDSHEHIEQAIRIFNKARKPFSLPEFSHLIKGVVGINFTDQMLNALFTIFDTNNDGTLDSDELSHVLYSAKTRGVFEDKSYLRKVYDCSTGCFYSEIGYRFM